VLGRGKRLFAKDADQASLRLVDVKPAGAVALLTLEPARAAGQ
jgi:hypothetical protein